MYLLLKIGDINCHVSLPEGKRCWQKMHNCIVLFVPQLWQSSHPMQPWHRVWLDLPHREWSKSNQKSPAVNGSHGSKWPSPWKSNDCHMPLEWACLGMPVCQALFQVPDRPAVTTASQDKTSTYHQHTVGITSHISMQLDINTKNHGLKVSINRIVPGNSVWGNYCPCQSPCRRDRQYQGHYIYTHIYIYIIMCVCVEGIAWLCLIWSRPVMPICTSTRCPNFTQELRPKHHYL